MTILYFATFCADHLTDLLSTKDALKQVLSVCLFQCIFESIEQKVEELLSVFLLNSIGRLPVKLFECKAKTERIVVNPFREL